MTLICYLVSWNTLLVLNEIISLPPQCPLSMKLKFKTIWLVINMLHCLEVIFAAWISRPSIWSICWITVDGVRYSVRKKGKIELIWFLFIYDFLVVYLLSLFSSSDASAWYIPNFIFFCWEERPPFLIDLTVLLLGTFATIYCLNLR